MRIEWCFSLLQDLNELEEPVLMNLTWKAERMASMESWVEQGDYLPLNVTYQLLAGVPVAQSSKFVLVSLILLQEYRSLKNG